MVEGRYYPGTFVLEMEKEFYEEMLYSSFSYEEMATFVHEYIHYLQDISTVYALTLYQHRAKLLQLNLAVAQREEVVKIPISLEECGIPNVYAKTEELSFYEGDKLEKKIHHINEIQIGNEEILDEILKEYSDCKNVKIPAILIYYDDKDIPTTFGARYIMESMAYLIEKNCFGADTREKEFPYNVCEIICEKIYPELLLYPQCIVGLCEIALMYEHSGVAFYLILLELKKKKLDSLNIISYLENLINCNIKKLEEINVSLVKNIDFLFPPNLKYMDVPNEYIKTIFRCGLEYRKKNHLFITNMFFEKDPLNCIKTWMEYFPTPMFFDKKKQLYGNNDEIIKLLIPLALLEYFEYPKNGCSLFEYCKDSKMKNANEDVCKKEPWKQCLNNEICPLAWYFVRFDLENKKFEIVK